MLPNYQPQSIQELSSIIQELHQRQHHAINTHVPTEAPKHNQLEFHKSTAVIRLLFGGNQSGKSLSAAVEIAWWARASHPHRETPTGSDREIWVIAPEYILIEKGIYRHLKNLIQEHLIVKMGPKIPQRNLPSYIVVKGEDGYETQIQFISARGDDSARAKFQAAAVDLIAIDEEIPADIWEELEARTLVSAGEFIISATLVESYEWITRLEEQAEEGDPEVHLTRLDTEFNPYVDRERLEKLMGKWSADTIEYRIRGLSRKTTGLMFSSFDKSHICKYFKIPEEWPRWCMLDPGWRTFGVLWGTVSPDEHKYIYRELYAHSVPLYQIAREIMEVEGWKLNKELSKSLQHFVWEPGEKTEEIRYRLIDDNVDSHFATGDQGPLNQLSDKYGIACMPAEKTRQGIEIIRQWIEEKEFSVFENCVNFIGERRNYRIKMSATQRNRPDSPDRPVKKQDHLMDAWRFWANENPTYHVKEGDSFEDGIDPHTLNGAQQIERILARKETMYERI